MATFYVGPRPVLKGRNTNDMINPWKGTKGVYSYYPLFAKGLLDGGPDQNHVPGTGRHPGNVLLSQLFTGSTLYDGTTPLAGAFADGTATYSGTRFRPNEYKGVTASEVLNGGHAKRTTAYSLYSNYIFDGIDSANVFASGYGHAERTVAYSLYDNYIFDGVDSAQVFPSGYGQANVESDYGRSKVQQWSGVDSSRAL